MAVSYILSFVITVLLSGLILKLISVILHIKDGDRQFHGGRADILIKIMNALFFCILTMWGLYLFPQAFLNITWLEITGRLKVFNTEFIMIMICLTIIVSFFLFILSVLYADHTRYDGPKAYFRMAPGLFILSLIASVAGTASILLISISFSTTIPKYYLAFYFFLLLIISMSSRKSLQSRMILITNDMVYQVRMNLIDRLLSVNFQIFEKIKPERIYTTFNQDTETISDIAHTAAAIITSAVTTLVALVYLFTVSVTGTLIAVCIAVCMGLYYVAAARKNRMLFEQTRDTQNVYMKLITGMVRGFKEISLHGSKKSEYKSDIDKSCRSFRQTKSSAHIKFINTNLISEAMILVILALTCIGLPLIFPNMSLTHFISYGMVLLYMIGPITVIMTSVPRMIQIRVAWNRIQELITDISQHNTTQIPVSNNPPNDHKQSIQKIEAKGIFFKYNGEGDNFTIGPMDLEVNVGEILFLTGGNGSGKTTIAKILTGLYESEAGSIKINGREIAGDQLGEYFSVVFSDFYLFEKLYNINKDIKESDILKLLKMLRLIDKVRVKNNMFSTLNLSGGQKKRLALLQCYLEDSPIYLFDELAADQDPEFRRFFYRELLLKMKNKGKIVIAITHDDHYFDVADKIIKLDMGKIQEFKNRQIS